jgi:spoIIIJ-associated protein
MEWVESTGRSIEAAKEAALDRLGVHEDDAEFDVLTEARVGLFGRIKEDARVRARVRPTAPRAKDDRRRGRGRDRRDASGGGSGGRSSGQKRRSKQGQSTEKKAEKNKSPNGGTRDGEPAATDDKGGSGRRGGSRKGADDTRSQGGNRSGGDARRSGGRRGDAKRGAGNGGRSGDGRGKGRGDDSRDVKSKSERKPDRNQEELSVSDHDQEGPNLEEQAALAEEFVAGLAEKFGTSLTFRRDDLEDDILRIEASGDDIGILVGRKGATAQAIDDLVRTVLQRAGGTTREGKIRVDIGGVRARRAAALSDFSRKIASDVIASGNEIALEPMGGADRKLVHDVVNEIAGVDTRSEGEDPYRRVVIIPATGDN